MEQNARTKRKMQGRKGKCKDDTKSDSLDRCEQVERSKIKKQIIIITKMTRNVKVHFFHSFTNFKCLEFYSRYYLIRSNRKNKTRIKASVGNSNSNFGFHALIGHLCSINSIILTFQKLRMGVL